MALPIGLSTVTVSGSFKAPDGTARKGKLLFTPEPAILTSATHDTLVLGTTVATLDVDGAFTVTLLATDDADVTPTGWTYRVTERWHDAPGRSYPLSLPAAAPAVDLADVTPTAPAEGEYVVITGPQGPPGSEADAEAYTDAAVAAHAAATTAVHGIPDTAALETTSGATAKVTTHAAATDPHGDRAYADATFATITVVTTLSGDVSNLDSFVQDCLTRVANIEQGVAFLAAVNTSLLSVASKHTLDGTLDRLGFHGVAPVARQAITGSRSDGTALTSLLTALHTLGLITDNTTA
ncbi:hypothetical protein [Streptomyces pacificus]|uniref:Uncharacterized protein n=1 Tax=Streptomyces pacificus TaxID=2705029 RepID=A0A6A0ANU8_9ACTN|nr:hypothetical protein [Streptomyces pacificus]GFH34308.1 hypothetical protein SCWH03_05220 [Streptomyces pacificus]